MQNDAGTAKRQRGIIALVAAHVIASVALAWCGRGRDLDSTQIACLALAASQAALVGFWIGVGQMRVRLRFALVCLGIPVIWGSVFFGIRGLQTVDDGLLVAASVAAIAVGAAMSGFFLRQVGLRIGLVGEIPADPAATRVQFTLLALFSFTTVTAILVACFLAARNEAPKRVFDLLALVCVAIVGTTVAAEWGALSPRPFGWRLLALLFAILIVLPAYYIERDWSLPTILLFQAAISTITLLIVRGLGYRLFVDNRRERAFRD